MKTRTAIATIKLSKELLRQAIDEAVVKQDWSKVDHEKLISIQSYIDLLDEHEIDIYDFLTMVREIAFTY